MELRAVSGGGRKVITKGRHGYGFVGGGDVYLPLGWRCSLETFFWRTKMWMHTVLHKDEIQVKESKVVVRDGEGCHWRPVARLHAPK